MQIIVGSFRFIYENHSPLVGKGRAFFIATTRREIWIEWRPWGDRKATAQDKAWEAERTEDNTNYYLGRLAVTVSAVRDSRAGMPFADSAESVGESVGVSATSP